MLIRLFAIILAFLLSLTLSSCIPFSTFQGFGPDQDLNLQDLDDSRREILVTAKKYLGVKYLKGGSSPEGFDCSGFVSYVFRQRGISLPRSAKSQYDRGIKVADEDVRPGDLLFFNINGLNISHVAIYVGRDRFIHAPSNGKKVSYASMEDEYWRSAYFGSATYIQ